MMTPPRRHAILAGASLFVAASMLLVPGEASALTCAAPTHHLWPWTDDPVPTNVAILVYHPTRKADDSAYALRPQGGQPVAISTERLGASGVRRLALAPDRPLRAHTSYEVVRRDGAGSGREELVGRFRTGAGPDTTAPAWPGLTGPVRREPPRRWDGPSLAIPVGPATDDQTPPELIRYAVWRLQDGEGPRSLPARPPDALVVRSGDVVRVGGPWRCRPANLALPRQGWPRLLLRPVDLAGNLGPARVIPARRAGPGR
jgi:hypothetical protein